MTKYFACIGTPPPFAEFEFFISKLAANVNKKIAAIQSMLNALPACGIERLPLNLQELLDAAFC